MGNMAAHMQSIYEYVSAFCPERKATPIILSWDQPTPLEEAETMVRSIARRYQSFVLPDLVVSPTLDTDSYWQSIVVHCSQRVVPNAPTLSTFPF
jgi:hypothetical protein